MKVRVCNEELPINNDLALLAASPQERVLRIVSEIYRHSTLSNLQDFLSLSAVAHSSQLQLPLHCPPPKVTVGLLADVPALKHAFLNWYTGDERCLGQRRQGVDASLRIVTHGSRAEELDGASSLLYFSTLLHPFAAQAAALSSLISAHISTSPLHCFPCIDFVDLPLVDPPLSRPTTTTTTPAAAAAGRSELQLTAAAPPPPPPSSSLSSLFPPASSEPDVASLAANIASSCDLILILLSSSRPLPSLRLLSCLSLFSQLSPHRQLLLQRLRFVSVDLHRSSALHFSEPSTNQRAALEKTAQILRQDIEGLQLQPDEIITVSFHEPSSSHGTANTPVLRDLAACTTGQKEDGEKDKSKEAIAAMLQQLVDGESRRRVEQLRSDAERIQQLIQEKLNTDRDNRRSNAKKQNLSKLLRHFSLASFAAALPLLLVLLLTLHPTRDALLSLIHHPSFNGLLLQASGWASQFDSLAIVGITIEVLLAAVILCYVQSISKGSLPTLSRRSVLELKAYWFFCNQVISYCSQG